MNSLGKRRSRWYILWLNTLGEKYSFLCLDLPKFIVEGQPEILINFEDIEERGNNNV